MDGRIDMGGKSRSVFIIGQTITKRARLKQGANE